MHIGKRILAKIVIAGAIALPVTSAHAGLIINFYNGANLYAQLTTSGGTNFDLHFIGTGNTAAFVNELFMDGPYGTFLDSSTDTVTTATYILNKFNGGDSGDGAKKIYDWHIQFPQPNDVNRLTAGEHALWSITGTDPDFWKLNKIHINAIDGVNSIKLDGICLDCADPDPGPDPDPKPVPLPGTLGLLGLGLMTLRLHRRKKV